MGACPPLYFFAMSKKKVRQYTKTFVTTITIVSIIWISISYAMGIYALMVYANSDLLSDLSEQICITLLGMSLGYFCKAFLETYSQKKNELVERELESGITFSDIRDDVDDSDGDAVG